MRIQLTKLTLKSLGPDGRASGGQCFVGRRERKVGDLQSPDKGVSLPALPLKSFTVGELYETRIFQRTTRDFPVSKFRD